ncbi:alkyl sulfatase dimerization domain-containing protein [Paraburkholderia nemoris]|uniref:alkyl sulfatase dimerization domain-containing protein n=1 Tax=Paraburkholderia nemoris TaxID=2793076 RepID=UPI0038BB4D06
MSDHPVSSPAAGSSGHGGTPAVAGSKPALGAAAVRLVRAGNGAIVNEAILDNARLVKHQDFTPYQLTGGVWVLPGPSLNAAVIEGPDGLIVWETGENIEHGKRYRELIRSISTKPIKAVIYSHTHYTLGTSAIIEGELDVKVIGHPKLNENMQVATLGSYFPEIEPLQRARAVQHAQMFLPEQGEDAKHGFFIEPGERGFVPVNTPVRHGEELTVAGIRLQFFTEGGSDTDDCTTVWLPEHKVALNNILWPWQPNFYTPRGAKFRDPRIWSEALRHILALQPEYLINQHGRSIAGREEIGRTLRNYLDFTSLVLDQTLRGILQGKGPEELRDFIRLPRHLAAEPWLFESYGRMDWHAPYIMNHAVGWWDGDAATLAKLPPQQIAERMVPLLGGRDKILVAAREARAKGELAWALELLNYPFRLTPADAEIRQLKADLLRESARACTASITRGFMLSQALALEGKITLPRVVPPTPQQIAANPTTFVNQMRVRVDPVKAQDTDAVMRFDFTDGTRQSVALHLRRGVTEFVERPDRHYRQADIVLTLDARCFAALFLSSESLEALVDRQAVVITGDKAGASAFLALFDSLRP